jgi:hypothetical protein
MKQEKPYIIHCELSLEQVKLLRDLLYQNEDFTCATKGGGSKQLQLAVSLSMAIENGCELNTENGTKNSEPAPKYAPCRLFRKGDKVRVVERDGRDYIDYDPYTNIQKSEIYTVLENENEVIDGGCVDIRIGKGDIEYAIPFYFLELVTPVEELGPYSVVHRQEIDEPGNYLPYYAVVSSGCEVARFYVEQYIDGQAKAAVEAECARLNEAYRKEDA